MLNKKLIKWIGGGVAVAVVLSLFCMWNSDDHDAVYFPGGPRAGGFGYPGQFQQAQWPQAQWPAARTGGWGNDNFWSSRNGSGNYNEDNTQGYVHIPGHGAVTYGF